LGKVSNSENLEQNEKAQADMENDIQKRKAVRRRGVIIVNASYIFCAVYILISSWYILTWALANTKEESEAWMLGFYDVQAWDIFCWDPLATLIGGIILRPLAVVLAPYLTPLLWLATNTDDPITFLFLAWKEFLYCMYETILCGFLFSKVINWRESHHANKVGPETENEDAKAGLKAVNSLKMMRDESSCQEDHSWPRMRTDVAFAPGFKTGAQGEDMCVTRVEKFDHLSNNDVDCQERLGNVVLESSSQERDFTEKEKGTSKKGEIDEVESFGRGPPFTSTSLDEGDDADSNGNTESQRAIFSRTKDALDNPSAIDVGQNSGISDRMMSGDCSLQEPRTPRLKLEPIENFLNNKVSE